MQYIEGLCKYATVIKLIFKKIMFSFSLQKNLVLNLNLLMLLHCNVSCLSNHVSCPAISISKAMKALLLCPPLCYCQDFKRAGISRLLKEKGREQFWPKKGNLLPRGPLKKNLGLKEKMCFGLHDRPCKILQTLNIFSVFENIESPD
jgi:hypothetical protein